MSRDPRERSEQHLPKLRLDELLGELQVRIDAVRGTRDRLHSLLEAVLSVGRELDLPQVLRSIVEAAVVLVDAEYGALGVIGADRKLSEFLTVGIDDVQRARIGALPSGHGLLGELIRHPEPLTPIITFRPGCTRADRPRPSLARTASILRGLSRP